jgi:P pilus assembly chaperone PapD
MKKIFFLTVLLLCFSIDINAQAGIAVTPGRVYFKLLPGAENTHQIKVTNPTDRELEVGVSFSDWNYNNEGGNNIQAAGTLDNSCSDWIQVLPETYFILEPRETRDVEVYMNVPANADTEMPVRTSMIFFTQLNPGQPGAGRGPGIQVTVRMGVKIYHTFEQQSINELDIEDFKQYTNDKEDDILELHVRNTGKIWTNGVVNWELFNQDTGKKTKLNEKEFYTLPNDLRHVTQELPEGLEPGNYTATAIVTYGESDIINIAEKDFTKE